MLNTQNKILEKEKVLHRDSSPQQDNINTSNNNIENNSNHHNHIITTIQDRINFIEIDKNGKIYFFLEEFICFFKLKYILIAVTVSDVKGKEIWFYQYDNGVYKKINEQKIRSLMRELILNNSPRCRPTWINESIQTLKDSFSKTIKLDDFNNYENLICFKNGILNINTNILEPHTSSRFFTIQIPFDYKKDIKRIEDTKYFYNWINRLLEEDNKKITALLQFIGLTISNYKGYRTKKAIFLVGAGNTGKSFIFRLLTSMLGANNTQVTDFCDLDKDFVTGGFLHKRLVGHADMKVGTSVTDVTNFKSMTGGDPIVYDEKFEVKSQFVFKGTMFFSGNKLLKIKGDKANHVYQRILFIKSSSKEVPEKERNPILYDLIEEEIEAIIYLSIEHLKNLVKNDFKYEVPDDYQEIIQLMKYENDPIIQFLEDCRENNIIFKYNENKKGILSISKTPLVYDEYKEFCKNNGNIPLNKTNFLSGLKELNFETNKQIRTNQEVFKHIFYECDITDWNNPFTKMNF